MNDKKFIARIYELRMARGVSARDMSLSLGQSESYVNKIENGKAFPSMQVFFYICEYFNITPKDFFDDGADSPVAIKSIAEKLKALDEDQLYLLAETVKYLKNKKQPNP